jgi:arylsulfatase A-like enzyme
MPGDVNTFSFSIIATVRNERATIAAFVDSLLNQSRKPDEILIVDGASTDGTREILEEYATRGLLRVISRPCNIAEGRNIGIEAATGTHLAVTDAGCRVDNDWLHHIAHCFERDRLLDVVAGNFSFETHTPFEDAVVRATFQPRRDETETARFFPSSRSVAFSKAAWRRAGGYPEWLYAAEDTLFNIRLRQIGCRFTFCAAAKVSWRPRETWGALGRQRVNFSRGNARVGIGVKGYLKNFSIHLGILLSLLACFVTPSAAAVALGLFSWHVYRHLWRQSSVSSEGLPWTVQARVLLVMEFVRIVNLYGSARGFLDRWMDSSFISRQRAYMGVDSVQDLSFIEAPAGNRIESALRGPLLAATGMAAIGAVLATWLAPRTALIGFVLTGAVAAMTAAALIAKSISDFSLTGPSLHPSIQARFKRYSWVTLLRLAFTAFILLWGLAGLGALCYTGISASFDLAWDPLKALGSAFLAVAVCTVWQFAFWLRHNPGLIVASTNYRVSRFYAPWRWATPDALKISGAILAAGWGLSVLAGSSAYLVRGEYSTAVALAAATASYLAVGFWAIWLPEPATPGVPADGTKSGKRPNVLMLVSDTLRADRLGALGYRRATTSHIDNLVTRGTLFANCYVPCARTAPSIMSLLTGLWPHHHRIRDNFVAALDQHVPGPTLPQALNGAGYQTAAVADWCGSDLGKFELGFSTVEAPADQWNLRYLIKQGPKDIRLFLSLFLHNRAGRVLLPEIYFLGGVPSTRQLGRRARHQIAELARQDMPFFQMVFYSTTHPPFASEWPWYTRYASPAYAGESKFAMARLTDPFEIIRRQGEPREEFDLDQILDLYDGCVAHFDDEVGRMLKYLETLGIADDTIVIVTSDHGMEFFEHGSWGQGNSAIGDYSARVPLVIFDPRQPGAGIRPEVVRSIDLFPTLIELLAPTNETVGDGTSLAAALRPGGPCPVLDAFNETGLWFTNLPGQPTNHLKYPGLLELLDVPDAGTGSVEIAARYRAAVVWAKDRMIRSGRWKLTFQPLETGLKVQLFDVEQDPECKDNLMGEHPDLVQVLGKRLLAWMQDDPLHPQQTAQFKEHISA